MSRERKANPEAMFRQVMSLQPDQLQHAIATDPDSVDQALKYGRYMFETPVAAREDPIEYLRYIHPDPNNEFDPEFSRYIPAPHHRLIADAFTQVLEGKILRLCLSMPPQHGKSTLAKGFLTTHIGKFPWKHLLMGTYNQDFANEYGDDVRSILRMPEYNRIYPDVALRGGSKAKDHMVTTDGGKLSFLGRGGSATGRPADGLLIDDLLKDAKEASSKTIRNDCWEFFTKVANTRCHALSWQVIIATRWSDDDVIARLTDPKNPHYDPEVAKQWTVVNVPAIMDDPEVARSLGKQVGDALWPERFPVPLLETARRMDPVGFSALYQGKPTPPEGAFYKEFMLTEYHSVSELPRTSTKYMTGDLAVTPEASGDRSCVGIWHVDDSGDLWLDPDLFWDKKASDEVVDKIIDMAKMHKIVEAFYEKGAIDKAIGPFLERRMAEKGLYFGITKFATQGGNKAARSISMRGLMAQGRVHFPAFAPWWSMFKDELLKFTGTGDDKSDDAADMAALMGQALDEQIKPGKPYTGNVVALPKVGTLAWTKYASNQKVMRDKRVARLRGM